MFKHVNTGVIVTDYRGMILALNPAAEEMTSSPQREMIGKTLQETVLRPFMLDSGFLDGEKHTTEVVVNASTYEVQITPMKGRAGRLNGQIILLYDITALKRSEKKLFDAYEQLQKIAAADPLTGLFNRRTFFELSQKALSRAKRHQTSFSLILIDLDNFKAVNDTKGHPQGDRVLQKTAQYLTMYLREGDILGRYGGDEFIVLAYDADESQALNISQRFSANVPSRLAELKDMDIPVTLSIGIACCARGQEITLESLLERADKALYRSKKSGRNRVTVWA